MRKLLLAGVALTLAMPAFAQINVPPGGSNSKVSAAGGGPTMSLSSWVAKIPVPDTLGNNVVLAPDGGISYRQGYLPVADSPTETMRLIPGIRGSGATMFCENYADSTSASPTAVGCNIVAAGLGSITLGGGDGPYFQALAPNASVESWVTTTPAYTGQSLRVATLGIAGAFAGTTALNIAAPFGLSAGFNATAWGTGGGSIALGNGVQAYGTGSLATGYWSYDQSSPGVRVHSSFFSSVSTSPGSNQLWEQTLQGRTTNTTAVRLGYDGTSSFTQTKAAPVFANGHGSFKIDVECADITAGNSAVWFVQGSFIRVVAALRFPYITGTGSPQGDSAMSTASLAVTADTTNNNFNITVTPPSGNANDVRCTAIARWMQRFS